MQRHRTLTTDYDRQFYARQVEGARRSAQIVVPLLLDLVAVGSVCDVGCGVGAWLRAFSDRGVSDVLGLDGDHVETDLLEIPASCFRAHDLTQPIRLERRFDLAVSLEVAEHLPASCAEDFVASLTAIGSMVLFSAAVPGQGGRGHVNERWQSYWARLFEARGFRAVDHLRWMVWSHDDVKFWYRQNMMLYVHADAVDASDRLRDLARQTSLARLDVVHPMLHLHRLRHLLGLTHAARRGRVARSTSGSAGA
ncbi:MAG: methyltransferase domain-containing protein [Ectothiorhodospiraceae bacterium]|nr:methyltransferase domain-containing protein [Ectothiorhodospiraceae bacterium]